MFNKQIANCSFNNKPKINTIFKKEQTLSSYSLTS